MGGFRDSDEIPGPLRPAALLAALPLLCTPLSAQDASPASFSMEAQSGPERIQLKNGEWLTGDVIAIDSTHVVIDHGSLGRRRVPIAQIVSIIGRDVHLIAADGEQLDVAIQRLFDGQVLVDDGAQIRSFEIATLRTEPSGIRISGSMTVGTGLKMGKRDEATANGDVDLVAKRDHDRVTGKLDWNFRETKNPTTYQWGTTQRRTRGELQYDHFGQTDLYFWANSSALNDSFADIDLQWISGAGAGYKVVKEKDVSLSASAGLAYVKMDFRVAEDREFPAGRAALNFAWTPAERVKVMHDSSVAPSLKHGDETDDVIVRLDTRVRWTIVNRLFAQVRWVVDHNRAPSPGFEPTDQTLSMNMGWSF